MQRVLAVMGAVALVVAAIVVRNLIEDDGAGASSDQSDGEVVVFCDSGLRAHCDELPEGEGVDRVVVEDSSATSSAIVDGGADEADIWITSADWFEVTAARTDAGTAEVLASTAVVVAADPVRAGAISALCGDQAIWLCLAEHAGEPWGGLGGEPTWGALKTGLPSADIATGLSVLTSVAVGYFGNADFAANDFEGTFRDALARLAEPSGAGDSDPLRALLRERGKYSAAGVLEARAERVAPVPPVLPTAPPTSAQIVLVQLPGGDEGSGLTSTMRDTLTEAGWADAGSGEPQGILKPGVMGALYDLWKDVT